MTPLIDTAATTTAMTSTAATTTAVIDAAAIKTAVIKTADLKAAGVPRYVIDLRCRPGGPWQRILPGVLLLSAKPPTRAQRVRAALAYAGPEAVLTGIDALRELGFADLPLPPLIHVLQPATHRKTGNDRLRLERTTRLPKPVLKDGLPLAPPARAVLDAARHEPHPHRQQTMITTVLRTGGVSVTTLLRELDAGGQRGSGTPRTTLRRLARDHRAAFT
ncbi:hypothetical protein FHS29_003978 [Saccharothrix tamanrassetensis]|uniref:AbiEi antitoxin C-terminal domain-containing protein n=1 Tax=Saccharothrix tamanrassetensis TaxID=1051531 RepID=A0A841CK99_9PSEU|nr:hypothetical protein [Saccharothrix tamanrassetensis]MBB5957383.1 hypothetical protein [Saccharothrix tamanrassetensis]